MRWGKYGHRMVLVRMQEGAWGLRGADGEDGLERVAGI